MVEMMVDSMVDSMVVMLDLKRVMTRVAKLDTWRVEKKDNWTVVKLEQWWEHSRAVPKAMTTVVPTALC